MPLPTSHRLVATPIPGELGCAEDCPHPDHVGAPINVTLYGGLEAPLRVWLADLGLTMGYMPTDPAETAGMRSYVVLVHPHSEAARLLKGGS